MTHAYTPTIGSISSGTLLSADLIGSFVDELRAITGDTPSKAEQELLAEADAWLEADADEEAPVQDIHEETGSELVNELIDSLNDHAPTCTYFGADEDDGACFGFWPIMEAVEELPHVEDPSEVPNHLGTACVFVNDHGNVTVYNADGTIAWDCV